MTKKYLISAIIIVVVCAIAGSVVLLLNRDRSVYIDGFDDDLYASQEGTITSGRRYYYSGFDKGKFDLYSFIEKAHIRAKKVYDINEIRVQERTIEAMAERAEQFFEQRQARGRRRPLA